MKEEIIENKIIYLDKKIIKYTFIRIKNEEGFLKKIIRTKNISFIVLILFILISIYRFLLSTLFVDMLLGVIILLTVYYNCLILIILLKEKRSLEKLKN